MARVSNREQKNKLLIRRRKLLLLMLLVITVRQKQLQEENIKKIRSRKELRKTQVTSFKMKCKLIKTSSSLTQGYYGLSLDVYLKIAQAVCQEVKPKPNSEYDEYSITTIFLDFVVSGVSIRRLEKFTGISRTSIAWMIRSTSKAINENLYNINTPKTPEEWKAVEDGFIHKGLVRTLGVLDGKHIQIKSPPQSGTLFYNYKNHFSIVLLALVDSDRRFQWIDVGAPGSTNDASIFNDSTLNTILQTNSSLPPPAHLDSTGTSTPFPSFICADGIFKLSLYCMKPYSHKTQDRAELFFNKRFSNTRVYVEHAFGMLAAKFRCLLAPLDANLLVVKNLITSLCIVHNLVTPKCDHPSYDRIVNNCLSFRNAREMRDELKTFFDN